MLLRDWLGVVPVGAVAGSGEQQIVRAVIGDIDQDEFVVERRDGRPNGG